MPTNEDNQPDNRDLDVGLAAEVETYLEMDQ